MRHRKRSPSGAVPELSVSVSVSRHRQWTPEGNARPHELFWLLSGWPWCRFPASLALDCPEIDRRNNQIIRMNKFEWLLIYTSILEGQAREKNEPRKKWILLDLIRFGWWYIACSSIMFNLFFKAVKNP